MFINAILRILPYASTKFICSRPSIVVLLGTSGDEFLWLLLIVFVHMLVSRHLSLQSLYF